ncbi:hypothetical protein KY289_011124 [Solanum tuberosum]|nr:hypothetical protein KY289_011124 [Solanum tuberosum]
METASSSSSPFQKTTPITPVEYTIGNLPRHRVYRQDPATEPEMVRPIGIRMPIEAPIKLQDGGDRGKILNIAAHDPQLWNSVIDVWKGIVVADYIHHYSETDAETMYRYMETFLGESIKGMWEAILFADKDNISLTPKHQFSKPKSIFTPHSRSTPDPPPSALIPTHPRPAPCHHHRPAPRRHPRPQPPTVAAVEDVAAAAEEVTPSRGSHVQPPFRPAPPPSRPAPPSPTFLVKATEEAQHVKKLIQDYFASFIKVGDKD